MWDGRLSGGGLTLIVAALVGIAYLWNANAQIAAIVAGALIVGLFTGWLASYWKAENFFVWFLFGALFPLVTLIILLVMPVKEGAREERAIEEGTAKRCPFCMSVIHTLATVCPHCQRAQPTSRHRV